MTLEFEFDREAICILFDVHLTPGAVQIRMERYPYSWQFCCNK